MGRQLPKGMKRMRRKSSQECTDEDGKCPFQSTNRVKNQLTILSSFCSQSSHNMDDSLASDGSTHSFDISETHISDEEIDEDLLTDDDPVTPKCCKSSSKKSSGDSQKSCSSHSSSSHSSSAKKTTHSRHSSKEDDSSDKEDEENTEEVWDYNTNPPMKMSAA